MSRLVSVPGGMVEAMATLPVPDRRALAVVSDSYANGTALVEVALMGRETDGGKAAAQVDAILGFVAHRGGCPPVRLVAGSWRLWCRAEDVEALRRTVLLALRDVTP